jgi:hypothetical protein
LVAVEGAVVAVSVSVSLTLIAAVVLFRYSCVSIVGSFSVIVQVADCDPAVAVMFTVAG